MVFKPHESSGWRQIGILKQLRTLHIGDVVSAHFFTNQGEVEVLSVTHHILYHHQCAAHAWSIELAESINFHVPLVKVGLSNGQNSARSSNCLPVMARLNSGMVDFHLNFRCKMQPQKPTYQKGDYDYVFPQNQHLYQQGTLVWHAPSQRCFRCKPWPFNAYCRDKSTQFEPYVGELWRVAWEVV